MTALLPAVLAGAGVAVAVGLPAPGRLRHLSLRATNRRPGGVRALLDLHRWGRRRAVGGALLLALGAVAMAGPSALLVLLALLGTWRAGVARRLRTVREQERRQAGEACAVLAGELRAGRAAAQALGAAAEVGTGAVRQALLSAASSAGLGGDVPAALLAHVPVSAAPELLSGLAACWQVCAGTGSGLAMAVDRLEEGLSVERDQRRAVEAELAGPRATAGLLALLPLAGIGLAAALGARPVHVLLHTSIGLACSVLGVSLDAFGVWWTRRLVAQAGGST